MRINISEAKVDYLVKDAPRIKTPEDAVNQSECIKNSDTEAFVVLTLDSKNNLRSADIVTMGLIDASLVHPREVFRLAVIKNASGVVLMHNHPSGDPTPSADDIRITKQMVEAGRILDIKVLDHIIIGSGDNDSKFISLREEGIVRF